MTRIVIQFMLQKGLINDHYYYYYYYNKIFKIFDVWITCGLVEESSSWLCAEIYCSSDHYKPAISYWNEGHAIQAKQTNRQCVKL